jgi:hypothetical protein
MFNHIDGAGNPRKGIRKGLHMQRSHALVVLGLAVMTLGVLYLWGVLPM